MEEQCESVAEGVAEQVLKSSSESEDSDDSPMTIKLYEDNTKLWERINECTREIDRLENENNELNIELNEEINTRTELEKKTRNFEKVIENTNRNIYFYGGFYIIGFVAYVIKTRMNLQCW
jgi:predicted RNase H-like nuclease (RuvC/YqgF family)